MNETPQLSPVSALFTDISGGVRPFPQPALKGSANFGGIGFDVVDALRDRGVPVTPIPVLALDDFSLDRLDFLKMDVEGYEDRVLAGARATIEAHRPVIWGEADRPNKTLPWLGYLLDIGYQCALHVHPYVDDGEIAELKNVFSFDLLALPTKRGDIEVNHVVYPVASSDDYLSAIQSWNQETNSGS